MFMHKLQIGYGPWIYAESGANVAPLASSPFSDSGRIQQQKQECLPHEVWCVIHACESQLWTKQLFGQWLTMFPCCLSRGWCTDSIFTRVISTSCEWHSWMKDIWKHLAQLSMASIENTQLNPDCEPSKLWVRFVLNESGGGRAPNLIQTSTSPHLEQSQCIPMTSNHHTHVTVMVIHKCFACQPTSNRWNLRRIDNKQEAAFSICRLASCLLARSCRTSDNKQTRRMRVSRLASSSNWMQCITFLMARRIMGKHDASLGGASRGIRVQHQYDATPQYESN